MRREFIDVYAEDVGFIFNGDNILRWLPSSESLLKRFAVPGEFTDRPQMIANRVKRDAVTWRERSQHLDGFFLGPDSAASPLRFVGETGVERVDNNRRIAAARASGRGIPIRKRVGRSRLRGSGVGLIRIRKEQPDLLRRAVVDELKLLAAEVGNRIALLVLRDYADLNQFGSGAKRRRLLGRGDRCHEKKQPHLTVHWLYPRRVSRPESAEIRRCR